MDPIYKNFFMLLLLAHTLPLHSIPQASETSLKITDSPWSVKATSNYWENNAKWNATLVGR